ncbi:MAG: ABC transporter ATP-binding protein [Rhodanobacter sp.]
MQSQGEPSHHTTAPEPAPLSSGLLDEIAEFGRAFKRLFGAQLHLLAAELGLARSAVSWMLVAGLAATVAGVGLGLSVLALIGMLLAKWFGSWLWAMLVLCLLQVLFLLGAILLFRRCMHWMSLPASRGEWSALMRDTLRKADRKIDAGDREQGAS